MASTASSVASWLVCRVRRTLCALPLDHVVEILRPLPVEPLADAPASVVGVSVLRGEPVPVVDVGHLLSEGEGAAQRLVALRIGDRRVALLVEGVIGVRALGAEQSELPPLLREAAHELVSAIGTLDSELLLFLRAARIVPEGFLSGPAALEPAAS